MFKILKTFDFKAFSLNGREVVIRARIEQEGAVFYWKVSHFYRPRPLARYYMPSCMVEFTIEMAESMVRGYVKSLQDSGDFIANANY